MHQQVLITLKIFTSSLCLLAWELQLSSSLIFSSLPKVHCRFNYLQSHIVA